jgi:type 1 glutamine amidotransferase
MKRALLVQGGYEGHEPREVAEVLGRALGSEGFGVEISDTLYAFRDQAKLEALNLIVPVWTMGTITLEQLNPLLAAVKSGVGLATTHASGGYAFPGQLEYELMVGGQFMAHPGGDETTYTVNIGPTPHPITEGLSDFEVTSEQYYMHVDPGNTVLATTNFGDVVMPVTWIKGYGRGRVFYCSLGHDAAVTRQPEVLAMLTRGLVWAASD